MLLAQLLSVHPLSVQDLLLRAEDAKLDCKQVAAPHWRQHLKLFSVDNSADAA